jgi:CRISPR-associated protein Cas1
MKPIKPVQIKERSSIIFLDKGSVGVAAGSMVLTDSEGTKTGIPVGMVTCIMLGPGIKISHAAVSLASSCGTLLLWSGDCGVRLYASGQPGGASSHHLLYQAKLALNHRLRLKIVREMYKLRFKEALPLGRSIEQIRGIEGQRVKKTYKSIADKYNVDWTGRSYDASSWESGNVVNRCLSAATACLYGITEAAILAAGFAPAIGFVHHGQPRAFVFDIADIFKFDTVVPIAFRLASENPTNPEKHVRLACRDMFRSKHILSEIIPTIHQVLEASGEPWPRVPKNAHPIVHELKAEGIGDDGHRS